MDLEDIKWIQNKRGEQYGILFLQKQAGQRQVEKKEVHFLTLPSASNKRDMKPSIDELHTLNTPFLQR